MVPTVTIIIPSKNSIYPLKKTIEDISLQLKVNLFEVIVLDDKSEDGSLQYADQARYEYYRKLKIQVVEKKDDDDFLNLILSPYVFWMCPGFILEERDSVFKMINESAKNKIDFLLFPETSISRIKRIFCRYYIKNNKIKFRGIFCNKENFKKVAFEKDKDELSFKISTYSPFNKFRIRKKS